jgi:CRISPR-associated endonuclease/helicase Cas3
MLSGIERRYYAHTVAQQPPEKWHLLEEHLHDTAAKAEGFASDFASAEWGCLAGLWHDLGKYSSAFQEKLLRSTENPSAPSPHVNHSSAGALYAIETFGKANAFPLAFSIAGHHAGLTNKTDLESRLQEDTACLKAARNPDIPKKLLLHAAPSSPAFLAKPKQGESREQLMRRCEFWIRMLYSALVDADFLDTEQALSHGKAESRVKNEKDGLSGYLQALENHIDRISSRAQASEVNKVRAAVLTACRSAADMPPGAFSLTVPTGGGKTLSSMDFALRHAIKYGLHRVIVVIPYTSIIEQNAEVYRDAIGPDAVIEHHSNRDTGIKEKGDELESVNYSPHELACENWDASIIVTTSAQFFDSLFSNRSSSCRKLHNIARSVVIFDEVQTFPAGLRNPILEVLQELIDHYSVSAVFCTATQPALRKEESKEGIGVRNIREIIPDPKSIFDSLRRVKVQWPENLDQPVSVEILAQRASVHKQVLVVVHRREDARKLAELMPSDTYHLSALMCPVHRSKVLNEIRERLKGKESCRVVSTQLVEAGVDVDFPVVMRAMAGLDSLAQAAGRCNREGKLRTGLFEVFVAETAPPQGILRTAFGQAKALLSENPSLDLQDPAVFPRFFKQLNQVTSGDSRRVQEARSSLSFATTADRFEFIEDQSSIPLIIPFDENASDALRRYKTAVGYQRREARRALQRYTINIYPQDVQGLQAAGAIEQCGDYFYILNETHKNIYNRKYGLLAKGDLSADPAGLIL